MKYKIEITQEAEKDFENIFTYISETLCNKQAALRMISLLDKNIRSLTDMPNSYPKVKDMYLKKMGLRFITVKNYIVFYTVEDEERKVYIVRILYGKRNWVKILQDDFEV